MWISEFDLEPLLWILDQDFETMVWGLRIDEDELIVFDRFGFLVRLLSSDFELNGR